MPFAGLIWHCIGATASVQTESPSAKIRRSPMAAGALINRAVLCGRQMSRFPEYRSTNVHHDRLKTESIYHADTSAPRPEVNIWCPENNAL